MSILSIVGVMMALVSVSAYADDRETEPVSFTLTIRPALESETVSIYPMGRPLLNKGQTHQTIWLGCLNESCLKGRFFLGDQSYKIGVPFGPTLETTEGHELPVELMKFIDQMQFYAKSFRNFVSMPFFTYTRSHFDPTLKHSHYERQAWVLQVILTGFAAGILPGVLPEYSQFSTGEKIGAIAGAGALGLIAIDFVHAAMKFLTSGSAYNVAYESMVRKDFRRMSVPRVFVSDAEESGNSRIENFGLRAVRMKESRFNSFMRAILRLEKLYVMYPELKDAVDSGRRSGWNSLDEKMFRDKFLKGSR